MSNIQARRNIGCYLTTIVCKVLNKKDDDKVLNNLRYFRDNILQNDEDFYEILKDYDSIGPILSFKIETDKEKEILANYLYNTLLIPISNHIDNKEHSKAIERYKIMTLSLINYYGLKKTFNLKHASNTLFDKDFNPKTAGHGRALKYNKILD